MIQEYDIHNTRIVKFPYLSVYTAFSDPDLLKQRWWPEGFHNTFEEFQFQEWWNRIFTMIWPDDKEYPNISKFVDIKEDYIYLEHINSPHFFLMIELTSLWKEETEIHWKMKFVDTEINEQLRSFLNTSNEQNFDRLERVLQTQNTL